MTQGILLTGAFSCNGKHQGSASDAAKILDVMDPRPSVDNTNRKKQGRGRGRAGTGRGRGSKTVDQTRSTSASSAVTTNGQLDKLTNKVYRIIYYQDLNLYSQPIIDSPLAMAVLTSTVLLSWILIPNFRPAFLCTIKVINMLVKNLLFFNLLLFGILYRNTLS